MAEKTQKKTGPSSAAKPGKRKSAGPVIPGLEPPLSEIRSCRLAIEELGVELAAERAELRKQAKALDSYAEKKEANDRVNATIEAYEKKQSAANAEDRCHAEDVRKQAREKFLLEKNGLAQYQIVSEKRDMLREERKRLDAMVVDLCGGAQVKPDEPAPSSGVNAHVADELA